MQSSMTPRELQVLQLMAQGLSNREIAEQLVISVDTARWYAKQIYAKLDVHNRTEAVVRASELGILDAVTVPDNRGNGVSMPRHNLPAQANPLIGRGEIVASIRELLEAWRLVTLTGPAGIGKTRLGLRVAREMIDEYEHGVFYVDLAPVRQADRVAATVATTLEVKERPDRPLAETLARYLRDRQLLLVLDNFEQIIKAAPLVGDMLTAAPDLHIIVTSREVLRIYGEYEYEVPPLSLPSLDAHFSTDALSESEAVTLFVQRAQASRRDFELNDENAHAIAEICVRLDGVPLAIELAAARVKLFTPQALLDRLDDRLDTLTSQMRDVPERQRTLRGAIDWSYDLLTPQEQQLFVRLGIFVGGWQLAAIETVCGCDLEIDTLDGLESLLNKSLVRQDEDPLGEPRFRMLETISEYARVKLENSNEANDIWCRYADYFVNLAEEADRGFRGPRDHLWMQRLETELENLRAVLGWTLEHDAELAVRMAGALGHFWYVRGYHTEGRRWCERALAVMEQTPRQLHALLLIAAGTQAYFMGDLKQGKDWCHQALTVSRDLEHDVGTAWSLTYLAVMSIEEPDEYTHAIKLAEEGLAIFRRLENERGIAQALNVLGELSRANGDYDQARAYYEDCLALSRETGEKIRVAMNLNNLSYVAYHKGDYTGAMKSVAQSLKLAMELDNRVGVATYLASLAGPLGASGQPELAVCLLGASRAFLKSRGIIPQPGDQFEIDRYIADLKAQLGEATYEAARQQGKRLSLAEAVGLALGAVEE